MTPADITIAVTVFDRRDYIEQAVASALGQTLPARVIVVEDCGPCEDLQSRVVARFGSRISYHRNRLRRGLFDNWNQCLELCTTPWLCLLHDDDFLEPGFAEGMVELATRFPDRGLYYGRCNIVGPAGQVAWTAPVWPGEVCQACDPAEMALGNPVCFPAELFRADSVRTLGGFHGASSFSGDWDMWARLAARCGAARTNRVIGDSRSHETGGRGTTRVVRNGKAVALTLMQAKKNAMTLRQHGIAARFDRVGVLRNAAISARFLLENAWGFSPRMLAYNRGLLLQSRPPHFGHWLFQALARAFGPGFVKAASLGYRSLKRAPADIRPVRPPRREHLLPPDSPGP